MPRCPASPPLPFFGLLSTTFQLGGARAVLLHLPRLSLAACHLSLPNFLDCEMKLLLSSEKGGGQKLN